MTAADALRAFIEPLAPGWPVQLGKWRDGGPTARAIIIKPIGGVSASLIREPQFSVLVIGGCRDTPVVCAGICESIISAAIQSIPVGLMNCTVSEPSFFPTAEDRPAFEMAVSVILSY